jgi:hypothetical protein
MTRLPSLALLAALAAACASAPAVDPRYRPAESVLEIVSVLRRHVPDDTYRFEPARDFTGRNVYRSSLLRLESLERADEPALRAGHMDGVIAFAKGRALERIRAYDLAAGEYRLAAEREPSLSEEALRSADVCDGLQKVVADAVTLTPAGGKSRVEVPQPDAALAHFEARASRLEALARAAQGTHHEFVVMEEIERNDVERARYFVALRKAIPDGDLRAVSELQRVAMRHPESKFHSAHLLELADLYADLSREYVEDHPPESLTFDPATFRDLVDSGARIYELVATKDGTPEKLEASRRLEAFIAFSLRVDRDRFTP